MEMLDQHCDGGAAPLTAINRFVSDDASRLVGRMMMVDPKMRIGSMKAVQHEIRQLLDQAE